MNKTVFFLVISLCMLNACSAQKQTPMKTFDIEKFNKRQKTQGYDGYYLDNGTYIKQFGDKKTGYIEYETPPLPEVFQIYRSFYSNGNLKLKGINFPNDFEKGIWKEYDEQGNLIKETDYDKGFDYTWEDLLKLLKEREIKIIDRNTTIRKDEGRWHVWYVKGIYVYNIFIDGKTGEILQDVKNEFEEGS